MPPIAERNRSPVARSSARRCFALLLVGLALAQLAPARAQSTAPAPTADAPRSAATDGNIWGALVYATNKPPTESSEEPPEFPGLYTRLGKAFPYRYFAVLGQHNQVIFREYESWLVPSKDLFVKLDSKGAAKGGGINLHLQFWQGQQVLVKTDTVLRPASPLFIAGPKWRDGRLIFVLVLQKVETKSAP